MFSVESADTFTRPGYTFYGWENESGTTYTVGGSYQMSVSDVILYAQWNELIDSTILFDDGTEVTKQLGSPKYINAVTGVGDGIVTYTSETPAVATVDQYTGEVTIIAVGTAIITAVKEATSTHKTVTNTYTLTVTELTPSTIIFSDVTKSIVLNGGPYINTVSGVGTGIITYTSGTPGTATVNAATGQVTLVAVGTTVITAVKAAKDTYTSATNSYTLTVTGAITYSIGGIGPSGSGIVFYITDGGLHGLEVAPSLWNGGTADPTRQWKTGTTDTPGTLVAIGKGYANTYSYMTGSSHPAALICRNYRGGGKSDWFLPSSMEIAELRQALGSTSDGRTTYGFTNVYWSSTQASSADGLVYSFTSGGSATPNPKTGSDSVRPSRAF